MEEDKKPKTQDDFATISEWYTYKITHPDEFEENDIEEEQDENKYPYIIVECLKCGYIIDEGELSPLPDESLPYDKRLKCPNCKNVTKFKYIKSKEEKEKILKLRKQKEEKEKNKKKLYIKATISKIKDDLNDLKKELEEKLKNGDITPERFSALMINLTFNIYKYYRHDDSMSLFFDDFRRYAYGISQNILENYYAKEELDETLNNMLSEYEQVKEFDVIYLQHSLEYAQEAEIVSNSSDIEMDRASIQADITRLEYQIEQQEKYNEEVKEILDKEKSRVNEIEEKSFFTELKRHV